MHRFFAILTLSFIIFGAVFNAGCTAMKNPKLGLRGGDPIVYRCETGETFVARYYSLSDRSLLFVKLTTPDGREHTLPIAISASGARYTDDREIVWWTKGDSAFLESRDDNGEWEIRYRDCKVINNND